jgi:hypothetical protein
MSAFWPISACDDRQLWVESRRLALPAKNRGAANQTINHTQLLLSVWASERHKRCLDPGLLCHCDHIVDIIAMDNTANVFVASRVDVQIAFPMAGKPDIEIR